MDTNETLEWKLVNPGCLKAVGFDAQITIGILGENVYLYLNGQWEKATAGEDLTPTGIARLQRIAEQRLAALKIMGIIEEGTE